MASYTSTITVTGAAYVDLGAGPLEFALRGSTQVYMIVADSLPAASDIGEIISGDAADDRIVSMTTAHVYLRMVNSAASADITVSTLPGASGGGGGGNVTVTNWPGTQPVSLAALPVLASGSNTIGKVSVVNLAVGPAAIATGQAAPTSSAAVAVAARTGAIGTGRVEVTLYNLGNVTVYIGASAVTTGNGLPILPGGSVTLATTAAIYAVTASGTGSLAYVEIY